MIQLSAGSCVLLQSAEPKDHAFTQTEHIVQVLGVKKVPSTGSSNPSIDRYRLIISDGINILQVMLATQLNHLAEEKMVNKYTIIALERITCNVVQTKRIVIILSLRVVSQHTEKIGNPTAFSQEGAATPGAAPSAGTAAGHQQVQPQRRQQPENRNRPIYPIEGLSPYQNNWTIKALVTHKSDIRSWSNQRGEGKLFNVTLMDDTGEIKATAFNAQAEDFYEKFEEGKVYYISKARVNLAKKKFSNLSNDYELGLDRGTEVEPCLEMSNVPTIRYNFVPLAELQELAKDSTCDVIAVVKEVGSLGEITSKQTNKQIVKRELTLVDKSGYSVRITLWGKQAEQWNAEDNPVVAFKGAKVGDYGGRSLTMTSGSTTSLNPDIQEAFVLRGWYDSSGAEQSFQAHTSSGSGSFGAQFERSQVRSVEEVKAAKLGENPDRIDHFCARATIMHIKPENLWYPGCPGSQGQTCNRKVVDGSDGWRCEKCNISHEKPEYKYMLNMAVADHSGQAWFQGYNDTGQVVLGYTADELQVIKDNDDKNGKQVDEIIAKANCRPYNFVCTAKTETYNDQARVRYRISKILPLDYAEEGRFLVAQLRSAWSQ